MKGLIICGGRVSGYNELKSYMGNVDLIICADRGAVYSYQFGIVPDLIVGDMDSIRQDVLQKYKEKNINMELFPREKDMTDSEIAIWRAVKMGCTDLIIFGAIGSRVDHSIANIFILKKLVEKNINAVIVNEKNEVMIVKEYIKLKNDDSGYKVSLIPLTTEVRGVSTTGLKYELNNSTLEIGKSIGVSNEFLGNIATVTVKEGLLLLIKSKD